MTTKLPETLMDAPVLHIQGQQASGDAGTFTSGAWQTRVLNTVLKNTIGGASLGSNQITLPAGVYQVEASAPAFNCRSHQARFYNVTDAADSLIGTSEFCTNTSGNQTQTKSRVIGEITITTQKVFELRHRCTNTAASNGLGVNCGFGLEVYCEVIIRKVG